MFSLTEEKTEIVIKKSKFIAYSFMVCDRDEAKAKVAQLKTVHPQATHICYGYIGNDENEFGFDDNGEPSGTAGRQIYSAMANSKLLLSLVAVVRYFGGVKLGVGGLSRAYYEAGKSVIDKAVVELESCFGFECESNTDDFRAIRAYLSGRKIEITNIKYGENVAFSFMSSSDISSEILRLGVNIISKSNGYMEVHNENSQV